MDKTNLKYYTKVGYILIYCPSHPSNKNDFMPEHRLVMEKSLGRVLTEKEIVHHINLNKSDNRIENLMLFPNSREHNLYHQKIKNKNKKKTKNKKPPYLSEQRICENCGKKYQTRRDMQRFCSAECRWNNWESTHRDYTLDKKSRLALKLFDAIKEVIEYHD